jgi:hypothetical protein
MTVRVFSPESNHFFHSHELREVKVEKDRIIIRLTNNDIMTLIVNHPDEIAKDIFAAIENNEDMSFPIGQVELR